MNVMPPKKDLTAMRKKLNKGLASKTLPEGASDLDKLKFKLCEIFIKYKRHKNMSQVELAAQIGIDESLISKILHYHIEKFTVDRLVKYLSRIHDKIDFDVKVA